MSQEVYLQGLSESSRRTYLENNAHHIDEGKYSKPLSEEDLAEAKTSLSDNCIKLSDYKEEFDEIKKQYKQKREPFEFHNKILLQEIRTKQRIQPGTVFHLPNFADGMMESYNELGEYLGCRKLRPDERQGNVLSLAQ